MPRCLHPFDFFSWLSLFLSAFFLSVSISIFWPYLSLSVFSAWLSLSQFVIIFFLLSQWLSLFFMSVYSSFCFFILLSLSRPVFSDCLLSLSLLKGFLYGCLMFFAVSNYLIFQTVSLYLSLFVSECLYLCLLFGHFYPYFFWLSICRSVFFWFFFISVVLIDLYDLDIS